MKIQQLQKKMVILVVEELGSIATQFYSNLVTNSYSDCGAYKGVEGVSWADLALRNAFLSAKAEML
jgi:hypothetical protein